MTKTFVYAGILICSHMALFGQNAKELIAQSNELIRAQQYEKAIPLLQKAANMGEPEAAYNLGVCYQFGNGIEKNDSLATHWYLISANKGWLDGQYKMSYAYLRGVGVPKDESKAFQYALLCAEQGDVECIFNVINSYTDGLGTAKDSLKVLEWAIRLAKMETPENLTISGQITSARLNLAHMFMNGKGVEKDLLRSYMWFLIYNESKRDFSVQVQEQQIPLIRKVEAELTDSEKETARKEAEKTIGRPLKNLAKLFEWNK